MNRLVATLVVNGICLVSVGYLLDGISFAPSMILPLTMVFTLLNGIVKPILKVLTFPISFLTLGLSGLLINVAVFYVAVVLAQGFGSGLVCIDGISSAFFASVVISIMNAVLGPIFRSKK